MASDHLQPDVDRLRRAFPDGVPAEDYMPLLAALYDQFSDRNLAEVIAEVADVEQYVVANDIPKASYTEPPPEADVERVRQRLLAVGWDFDAD